MRFDFAPARAPTVVRVGRALVWTQAAFVGLAGLFVVFVATLFGPGSAIPFRGQELTGGRALILGVVYVGAALALLCLGVAFGRMRQWSRPLIICVQVFLAILLFARATDVSLSVVVNVALYVAVIAMLFAPGTRRAFDTTEATAAAAPQAGDVEPARPGAQPGT